MGEKMVEMGEMAVDVVVGKEAGGYLYG